MFNSNEEVYIICSTCESEYSLIEHHSDHTPSYCAYCGEQLSDEDDA